LLPTDSLFSASQVPRLPAKLVGGRPARHALLWEGYFLAAEALVNLCLADPAQALRLVYPILFSYRHAVELALKFFIDFYGDGEPSHTHDLVKLWSVSRGVINCQCGASEGELDIFGRIISELHRLDPASTSFRYAWKRRTLTEEEALQLDYPHDRDDIDIDLGQIAEIMGRVKEFLNQVDFDLMDTGRGPWSS
jgi:hypothetical protein